jgi:integrase
MINSIYKSKKSRMYRWKFRQVPADGKILDVSLETPDKSCAEKRRAKLLEEKLYEREGLIPSKAIRDSAQRKLADQLQDFLSDLRRRGKSEKYLANLEFRIGKLIVDCHWNFSKDVTADKFQTWLRSHSELKDKTSNDYLEAARCFFNWLVKLGRTAVNPLLSLEKVKTKIGAAQEIRAFSDSEMTRLLAVAGERKALYLVAVHTGLRASELAALKWADIHLDAEIPFVSVRASTTKNGKSAEMRLHPELIPALKEIKSGGGFDDETIFKKIPRIERFRRDLIQAKIAPIDSFGRKAVFHSLRHTFGTNLARGGVASRVAMTLMRHSDRRLTDKIYTDEKLLGTAAAIDALPSYEKLLSQGHSLISVTTGQNTSQSVTVKNEIKSGKAIEFIDQSHILTPFVTASQKVENGGSGGARTRNLCRDRAAL